jgi:hypothetical protein
MRRVVRRFGIALVVLDLFVDVASAAVLHHGTGASAGKMSAGRLEQVVGRSIAASHAKSRWALVVHTSCSAAPGGGWDYYCVSSDGSRTLYDVSGDRITLRSDRQPDR